MENTKIDWCDSTWNPITGCQHGCKYCYAKGITDRFGKNYPDRSDFAFRNKGLHILDNRIDNTPYPFGFEPTLHAYRLNDYIGKQGRNIFVCSMADLFGEWVPDEWIEEVFKVCAKAPQHNYLFLTKNPKRYLDLDDIRKLPIKKNMWYGVSVTTIEQLKSFRNYAVDLLSDTRVFLSIEPILEDITESEIWKKPCMKWYMDWVIIGAETGRRKNKVTPKREWIENIVNYCKESDIPVFMKSSIADIWGEPLVQEFPETLMKEGK